MEGLIVLKSDFVTTKLIIIWSIVLVLFLAPWLAVLLKYPLGHPIIAIVINCLVIILILFLKVNVKVAINTLEQKIEYHWVMLWGKKGLVTINTQNAGLTLEIITSRGNDLYHLIIIDKLDLSNKISLVEVSSGFDDKQILFLYQTLQQSIIN